MREWVAEFMDERIEDVFVGGDRRPLSETRWTTGYRLRISPSFGNIFGFVVAFGVLATYKLLLELITGWCVWMGRRKVVVFPVTKIRRNAVAALKAHREVRIVEDIETALRNVHSCI